MSLPQEIPSPPKAPRVLLLVPTTTYKVAAFMDAAFALGVQVVVGSEKERVLGEQASGKTLTVNFLKPEQAADRIIAFDRRWPLDAIVGTDDETVLIAAMASQRLGLPHNRPEAVAASRDKERTRQLQKAAGLRAPGYRRVGFEEDLETAAAGIRYPCVIKPVFLSAGRGVIKADTPEQFLEAFERIGRILRRPALTQRGGKAARYLLVEDYLPGDEVSLEGLLTDGRFRLLALFDKPDRMEGPVFQETMFVTPSRLPGTVQAAVAAEAEAACAALGLTHGPVHVELRIHDGVPWLLEIAARTIGGLCSRSLRFGTGCSLEELVLRHAVNFDTRPGDESGEASGVLMLPMERAGILKEVRGCDAARQVPGITELTVTLSIGSEVIPPPEGNSYLGFLFARGKTPAEAEKALRIAWSKLEIVLAEPAC